MSSKNNKTIKIKNKREVFVNGCAGLANYVSKFFETVERGDERILCVSDSTFVVRNDQSHFFIPDTQVKFLRCKFKCSELLMANQCVFQNCIFEADTGISMVHDKKISLVGCTKGSLIRFTTYYPGAELVIDGVNRSLFLGISATGFGKVTFANITDPLDGVLIEKTGEVVFDHVCMASKTSPDCAIRINDMNCVDDRGLTFNDSTINVPVIVRDSLVNIFARNYSTVNYLEVDHSMLKRVRVELKCAVRTLKTFRSTFSSNRVGPGKVNLFPTQSSGYDTLPGMFIYKKADLYLGPWFLPSWLCIKTRHQVIVELRVPEGARRHASLDGKVRVERAKVFAFRYLHGKIGPFYSVRSFHYPDFTYKLCKNVRPDKPFDNTDNTCASGIHGFLSVEEAQNY